MQRPTRPGTTPCPLSHLYLRLKVYALLALVLLALLVLTTPNPARAQGWRLVNTDADGSPIPAPWQTPGDDGYYRMFGQTDASATHPGGGYTWWLGPIPSLVSESQPGFGLSGGYPGSLTASIAQANDPRFTLYGSGSVCLKSSQSARLGWVYYDANGSPTAPPAGAPPAPPLPGETDGHVDLLVRTVLSTTTGAFSPSATAHVDASDGLGGSLSADAPDPLNPSPFQYAVQSVSFYHLVRAAVTGGSAQVTLNAVQNGSSSSALAGSTLNADARFDSRDVTISTDVDPTWHKSPKLDENGNTVLDAFSNIVYQPQINLRDSDGTMHGDVGLGDLPPGSNPPWSQSINYIANTSGSWRPLGSYYSWYSSLDDLSAYGTLGQDFAIYTGSVPNFVVSYNRPIVDVSNGILVPGQVGQDHIHLTYQDADQSYGGDGATATANYYMSTCGVSCHYEQRIA